MQQQNINISLDKTIAIACDECGSEVFREGVMLRKVSRFLTGQMQDGVIPIPVFVCQCGHVNQEFIPKELQDKQEDED